MRQVRVKNGAFRWRVTLRRAAEFEVRDVRGDLDYSYGKTPDGLHLATTDELTTPDARVYVDAQGANGAHNDTYTQNTQSGSGQAKVREIHIRNGGAQANSHSAYEVNSYTPAQYDSHTGVTDKHFIQNKLVQFAAYHSYGYPAGFDATDDAYGKGIDITNMYHPTQLPNPSIPQ